MTESGTAEQVPQLSSLTPESGLTATEVEERRNAGLSNAENHRTSRSVVEILRANIFTRFNAILGVMFGIVVVVGEFRDALFGLVLVANAAIGIIQELRSKVTLDRLSVLNAPFIRVMRGGVEIEIPAAGLVLDDLIALKSGDQVPADGLLRSVEALEVDESLLTGEADALEKSAGGYLLSGSIVVAGSGVFQATAVGESAYAHRLANEVRRFALVHSEIVDGVNRILKFVTIGLFIVGPLLFWNQLRNPTEEADGVKAALVGAVAGVVGMVPEGLVLLTSLAFGIAAVTLARRKVLVQELPAIEVLARVDVVCIDKTGTLTEGSVALERLEILPGASESLVADALAALASDESANATLLAVRNAFPNNLHWQLESSVAFSSSRKWSATSFRGQGAWWLGAPEMLLSDATHPARRLADEIASTGSRVLALLHADSGEIGDSVSESASAVALVVLAEQVRPGAAETLEYFTAQGVGLKIISGDNPLTVAAVARRVGVAVDEAYDARNLPSLESEIAEVLERHSVFGRVSPEQKQAMVSALQSKGHVVAMTGDGVNDALALKRADIGVAMGSGAPATRAVAKIVLLDGRFDRLPGVVAEGRRVIANVERVANLFVSKTTYAALIAIAVIVLAVPYPFLPRHLTIVSTITIGLPAFFLALAPNAQIYRPGFVRRVLKFAIPAGTVATITVLTTYLFARSQGMNLTQERTLATLSLVVVGLWILTLLARPLTRGRYLLLLILVALLFLGAAVPFMSSFFAIEFASAVAVLETLLISAIGCSVLEVWWRVRRTA